MADNNDPMTQQPGYFSPLGQRNWLESLIGRDASNTALNVMKPIAVAGDVAALPISLGAQFLAGATGAKEGVSATPFYDYTRPAEQQQKPVVPGVVQGLGARFADILKAPSNVFQAAGNFLDPEEVSPVKSWTPKTDALRDLPGYNPNDPRMFSRTGSNQTSVAEKLMGDNYRVQPEAKAQPKSGPISVVRALQNTNYLPVMDQQGRVSYQSEDFTRQKAAEQLSAKLGAAKTTAEIDKLLGEAQKARTPVAADQAINTYLGLLRGEYEPLLQDPDANTRKKAVVEYRNAIADVIAKFGFDARMGRLLGQ